MSGNGTVNVVLQVVENKLFSVSGDGSGFLFGGFLSK